MPNQQHRVGDDLVTDMPAMAPVLRLTATSHTTIATGRESAIAYTRATLLG